MKEMNERQTKDRTKQIEGQKGHDKQVDRWKDRKQNAKKEHERFRDWKRKLIKEGIGEAEKRGRMKNSNNTGLGKKEKGKQDIKKKEGEKRKKGRRGGEEKNRSQEHLR